jgi:hypothetical protein
MGCHTDNPAAISDDLKHRIVKWYYEDQLTVRDISISSAECSILLALSQKSSETIHEYGEVNNPAVYYLQSETDLSLS